MSFLTSTGGGGTGGGSGGGSVTVIDSFEDGDMSGWQDDGDMWSVVEGLAVDGSHLLMSTATSGGRFLSTTSTIHDDGDRNLLKPSRGYVFFGTDDGSDGWFQFRFRVADADNYWRLQWRFGGGGLSLEVVENGNVVRSDADWDNGAVGDWWYRYLIEIDDGETFGRGDDTIYCRVDLWDRVNQTVEEENVADVQLADSRHAGEAQMGAQIKATGQEYWLDYIHRAL